MLVPILLSIFWAVCSTVLIQPWFWKGIFIRKTLSGDEEHRGWGYGKKQIRESIIMQIICGCSTFAISLLMYLKQCVRYNFYGSITQILLVLIFQWLNMLSGYNENRTKKSLIILGIAIICSFFSITDFITSNFEVVGLAKEQEEIPIMQQEEMVISATTVKSLFKADSVSGPVYSNGNFIYTISNSINGYGVVVINEKDSKIANFISCNYEFKISSNLRQEYPVDRIKELNIIISNDNIPYGKYAILDKTELFGPTMLSKYVLQNMLTGEFTEYTVETLPEFAQ